MNVKLIFGNNLKQLRKTHKLTQEELSEKLGITPTHLSRIENGNSFVTSDLLDALCVIFNTSPATLFLCPQEFTADNRLFTRIDSIIDTEIEKFTFQLKEKIKK